MNHLKMNHLKIKVNKWLISIFAGHNLIVNIVINKILLKRIKFKWKIMNPLHKMLNKIKLININKLEIV